MKNTFRSHPLRRGAQTFTCDICGHVTRHTGVQSLGSKLCPPCYELAGIENEISDGHCSQGERQADIDAHLATIAERGGSVADWQHLVVNR